MQFLAHTQVLLCASSGSGGVISFYIPAGVSSLNLGAIGQRLGTATDLTVTLRTRPADNSTPVNVDSFGFDVVAALAGGQFCVFQGDLDVPSAGMYEISFLATPSPFSVFLTGLSVHGE